jgi:hypothetical protein
MCELLSSLRSIPDVVWSGVIASVLTLSGVLLSNRSNTTRLRIQLNHDAEEKAKERTAILRREVYLKTVEELTKANSHLASLPQKNPTKENLAEGFQGFLGAAAKLQLVAEPKTALLVNQLVAAYGELMLRVMGSAMPLHRIQNKITVHDDLYNQAQAQVTRILAEMAKFNEAGQINDAVFSALQRSFEGFQAQASQHADARSQAWGEFNRNNVEFCKQLIIEMRAIGEQQIPVLVEIRRDLGLITELEAFREQMAAQWNRMSVQLETLLQKLSVG